MKERLDRYRERLTPEERRIVWARLQREWRGSEPSREVTVRRWVVSFSVAAIVIVVAAVLFTRSGSYQARTRGRGAETVARIEPGVPSGPTRSVRIVPGGSGTNLVKPGATSPAGAAAFTRAREDSVSRFAVVVGGASYAEARAYLDRGVLPPPGAIAVEDFVNAFRQDYREFDAPDFRIYLDGAPSPFRIGCSIVRVGVKARGRSRGGAHPEAIARNVRVHVSFDPSVVDRYRLLGFDDRGPAPGGPTAGAEMTNAIQAGHEVTALYEVELVPGARGARVLSVEVRYEKPGEWGGGGGALAVRRSCERADLGPAFESSPARFRLDVVAAKFAEMLKHGGATDEGRIADLLPLARELAGELSADPQVGEFASLVQAAADLPRAGSDAP